MNETADDHVALGKTATPITRLTVILLSSVLVAGVLFGARLIAAEILLSSVQLQINTWYQSGQVPSLTNWQEVKDRLTQAKRLNPYDMHYDLMTAEVYEWRRNIRDDNTVNVQVIEETGTAILDAYRAAINARPHWPESWARLARQKAYMNEIDSEFVIALENVESLGRWSPDVQFLVSEAAAVSWNQANSSIRALMVRNIERGVAYYDAAGRRHLRFLQFSNLIPLVCPLLDFDLVSKETVAACG